MIALALSLLMMVAQAPAAPAATPVKAPATAETPAAPQTPAPASVSPRLEAAIKALKGQQRTAVTEKLGPPDSVKQGSDGQVLFWTVVEAGETVCGGNESGNLVCVRQGGGECVLAMAFKTEGGLSIWKIDGNPPACDRVADLFKAKS